MSKILVVDDERNVLSAFEKLLGRSGHEVATERRAAAALDRLRHDPFDLVILDIRMPGMDGLEALRQIKQHQAQLPVIIVTGQGTMETAIEATQCGAFDYQLKPFEPEEVAAQAKRERASEEDLHRQRQAKLFLRARAADFQRGQGMAGPVEVTAAEAGLVDEWQVVLTPKPGVTGPPITVVVPARDRSAALLAAAASNPNYLVGAAWLLSRRWR